MADKTFRNWIRSVLALPFLPINRIEAAVDRLREEQFDKSSPFSDKMESFKHEFCDYIEDVWLNGNYNPKIWNSGGKRRTSQIIIMRAITHASTSSSPVFILTHGFFSVHSRKSYLKQNLMFYGSRMVIPRNRKSPQDTRNSLTNVMI